MEMGLSCGVTSYDQRLFFTLMADGNCLPEVDAMMECFEASYDDLRSAAKVEKRDYVALGVPKNGKGAARVGGSSAKRKTATRKKAKRRAKKAGAKKGARS